MSDGETLSIGTVDDIQKLHIRTVHLGESAKRVVHQKETGTLGVLVYRDEVVFLFELFENIQYDVVSRILTGHPSLEWPRQVHPADQIQVRRINFLAFLASHDDEICF